MIKEHLLLGVLWILFGVVHSVLAHLFVKQKVQRTFPKLFSFYRLLYNLIAFLSFGGIVYFQFTLDSIALFQTTQVTAIVGGIVATTGLLLMAICIKKYFLGLSGLQSLLKEERFTNELHISGVHRFVRHPLYVGTFVFIWGLLMLFPTLSLFISNTIITIYTLVGIGFEEKKLVRLFGQNYKIYQQSVPMLVPRWTKRDNIATAKSTGLADS